MNSIDLEMPSWNHLGVCAFSWLVNMDAKGSNYAEVSACN